MESEPKISSPEKVPSKLEVMEQLTQEGLDLHNKKHGRNGIGGEDSKDFHGVHHPEELIKRAEKIANVFRLTPERIALIKMILAWHDIVLNYTKPLENNLTGMITRHRGAQNTEEELKSFKENGNEALSAKLLTQKMRDAKVFTEEEIELGKKGVYVTYPEATFKKFIEDDYYKIAEKQNPELVAKISELEKRGINSGLFFYQTHLRGYAQKSEWVPEEVLIPGLVDLGGSGLVEDSEFTIEGNSELRELYYNIRQPENLDRLKNGNTEVDKQDRAKVVEEFLKWTKVQVGFVVFQAMRVEKIINALKNDGRLDDQQEQQMRGLLCNYMPNIDGQLARSIRLKEEYEKKLTEIGEREAFIVLAKEMGYKL